MHISMDITGSNGNALAGKKIILCLTGSVAVIRVIDLARELMRLGAAVFPVMTKAAQQLVTPDLLEWATGHKPVTRLTGAVEHVALAGNVQGKADLILVAPATANTISKIACGIDDTPVTTFATTALGEGIPMLIVPAMHESMYHHPLLNENIEKLKKIGVLFVDSRIGEGKAKIASNQEIIAKIITLFQVKDTLKNQRVLITAGPTIEYIDPVRIITNKSSGKMGIALARAAVQAGASVTLIYGPGRAKPPEGVHVVDVKTAQDMYQAVEQELHTHKYDIVIAAAAVGDWTVKAPSLDKIPTKTDITLHLTPTIKIIDRIKELSPAATLVCFRALTNKTDDELIADSTARMEKAHADFIVVNDVSRAGAGFDVDTNEVFVIDKAHNHTHIPLTTKEQAAHAILQIINTKKDTL